MIKVLFDCMTLYVSDVMILLFFAAGASLVTEWFAHRIGREITCNLTERQVTKFLYFQLALLLIALIAFKYVVLSSPHDIAVKTILSKGPFTRWYSAFAISFCFWACCVGAVRWIRALRQWFILKWREPHANTSQPYEVDVTP
jgi:hypothetical protein